MSGAAVRPRAVVLDVDGLDALIAALVADGRTVVGPTVRDGAIVCAPLTSSADLPRGLGDEQDAGHYRLCERDDDAFFGFSTTASSWKRWLFPARQLLWRATRGADGPVLAQTPDFIKSIPVWKALDESTLIAYEMNGEPLPHWNGFPARLVVPGWTATYWMKHLTTLSVVTEPFKGFWMATAYRIPKGRFALVDRFLSQETDANTPITEMVVNSLITNLRDGSILPGGKPAVVRGVAWDNGAGMRTVDVSLDGGGSWRPADLGEDLGRYAWRQWSFPIPAPQPGDQYTVMARATNRIGGSQTLELVFNPAGYHNNVVQPVRVRVL